MNMDINVMRRPSDSMNTPAYPSGHSLQSRLVAEYYAEKYPDHKEELIKAADECGVGRVMAGWHYPSDHKHGVKLAKELGEYLDYDIKEDAPVNSTGAGISMAPTALGRKKKKKKFDIYTR